MSDKNKVSSIREIGQLKKRKKRIKKIIVTIFLLIVASSVLYYNNLVNSKPYSGLEELFSLDYIHEVNVKYVDYLDGLVRYTKDGAVAIGADGKLLWNLPFEVQDAIVSQCGNYFAIANRGSKEIHIINKKGETHIIKTLFDISDIEVASQGVVAALMEEGATNYIRLYDLNGEELVRKDIDNSKYGYSLDIALSENATKLSTSFISVKTGIVETKLSFYNYSDTGKNYPNLFVGGIDFKDLIIPKITFLNNDTLCAFTDKGFILYSIIKTPEEISRYESEYIIKSIVHNGNYIGLVIDKSSNDGKYALVMFDIEGTQILEIPIDYDYEDVVLDDKGIVIYDATSLTIIDMKGKKKFSYKFEDEIFKLFPSKEDKYFIINDLKIRKIKLSK
ncbi:MAG TPA: hypothetical protein GXZ90_07620 [Clostridiales bacterium]|nr:hypothetical protein [Clostridiales bacterium]